VSRPELLRLLGLTSGCKLTLISAPAGYGKTTLLSQWRQSEAARLAFGWVSLDEQDNDPVRLWTHAVEALRRVTPDEGFGADVMVGMGATRPSLVETTLPVLINELSELDRRVILVLDDYQFVTNVECHDSVAFFVDHLPENAHLVVSSRSEPRLRLARLRARGEMNEIRTEELAFSEDEAAYLLQEAMGLDIGADDLSVLLERTEGWPAAIYLAGLSLRGSKDAHAFIESFGGSSRYIVDLLGEEVLAGLPEEEREFLLRTSVLRRMTGPLCDTVVGREGSGKVLRELARSNPFVVPLDEQGEWYRYHHLFSDLLLYELKSSHPELVPVLHDRASTWCEGAGLIEPAMRHAIAAADHERVRRLIARYWFGYLATGRIFTVEGWLEALPDDLTNADAPVVLVKAWISAVYGRGEERERYLALAEDGSYEGRLPDGTASVESGVATIRSVFGWGGVQSIVVAARRAAALDPERTSPLAALVRFGVGSSLYLSGDTSRAREALEEALELTSANQPLIQMSVLSALSLAALDEGHLEEAGQFACEARKLVDRFRLHVAPQASLAHIALGRALAERGKLGEAQAELEGALTVRGRFPDLSPWLTLLGLEALVRVSLARDDRAGARVALAEARAILEPFADDAGIFPELLGRQERKLRTNKQRDGYLNEELSERELAVLGLLAGELSTRQMGNSLFISTSTVRTHIKSIYRKLGVSSRKEAVEHAHGRGLI
jgi:LuxR family maltose regulon positive regulatory protein